MFPILYFIYGTPFVFFVCITNYIFASDPVSRNIAAIMDLLIAIIVVKRWVTLN